MDEDQAYTFEIRIAEIFGTTPGEPLPDVTEETLKTYYHFLDEHLNFPVPASFPDPVNEEQEQNVNVVLNALLPPEDHPKFGPYFGLLCRVEEGGEEIVIPLGKIEITKEGPEKKAIDDYSRWYWNYR